jgi:hypothetical protein
MGDHVPAFVERYSRHFQTLIAYAFDEHIAVKILESYVIWFF